MKTTRYRNTLNDVAELLERARAASSRSINAIMTTTYFLIGRRIVEEEQSGRQRADYGAQLIDRLATDLTGRFGRGFGRRNLFLMRSFYVEHAAIVQTPSAQSFPLPWSHYVRLLAVKAPEARRFYEAEALRGGWTHAQLDRQIQSQFFERTALSTRRLKPEPSPDRPAAAFKEPYLLEFLDLKDEYSESDFEAALVARLETFLLELGGDFAFIGRQKRLRIGEEWYRVDLLLFHRRLRCLVIIDLKLGKFSHADAGQMRVYLNYAKQHWMIEGENPPVGLVLCAEGDRALAHYALGGLDNHILAAEYRTVLPAERLLVAELQRGCLQLGSQTFNRPTEFPAEAPRTPRGSGAPASTG